MRIRGRQPGSVGFAYKSVFLQLVVITGLSLPVWPSESQRLLPAKVLSVEKAGERVGFVSSG